RALHHTPPGGRRSSEGNFIHPRMLRQPRAQAITTRDNIQNAPREDIHKELPEFQSAQRSKWRRLPDDRIPRQKGWSDFPSRECHGKIPGCDGCDYTERHVTALEAAAVFFINGDGQIFLCKLAEPECAAQHLSFGIRMRFALLASHQ